MLPEKHGKFEGRETVHVIIGNSTWCNKAHGEYSQTDEPVTCRTCYKYLVRIQQAPRQGLPAPRRLRAEVTRLRDALDAITRLPVGGIDFDFADVEPCSRCGEAHDIARAALEGMP